MATADGNPSRIDQVSADPRWVGEALTAAAADAIDRHQRAGVPMVVFRDGRVEHVPAERLGPDVGALLKDVDFEAERSASELIAWFEERRSEINSCLLAKEPALFYEELYPFALWLGHRYAGREDVMCSLNSGATGDSDYDAVVKDRATDPPTVTYVQLTTTTFVRAEFLKVVPAHGPSDESVFFTHEERLSAAFDKIERVVRLKSKNPYGPQYVLVVCFDDFMWFGTEDDRTALTSLVTTRLPSWGLNVATLYVVGISGRTLLSFPIRGR